MKLTQLSKKPELIKLQLDDADTIAEYGEPLEFWIYDRTDMDVFVKMATLKPEDFGSMVDIVNGLILDEDGTPVVREGYLLPTSILSRVIARVVETFGKVTDEALDPESSEMAMILAVDAIAKRYSLLPTEVLTRASTFDLVILDTAIGYERYVSDKANGKKPQPKITEQDMLKMLNRVRQRDANKN